MERIMDPSWLYGRDTKPFYKDDSAEWSLDCDY
jgi:hypothetical protein